MIPIGNMYRDLTVSQARILTLTRCLHLLTSYPAAYEKRILTTAYADKRMGGRESLG